MPNNFTYNSGYAGLSSSTYAVSNGGTYSISSGTVLTAGSGFNGTWASINNVANIVSTSNRLDVVGDANFHGDIMWKGKNIGKMLDDINKRLAILVPDPAKLEKFEALRKAYDHYKLMESLCYEENNNDRSN